MDSCKKTADLIQKHFEKYPKLQIRDIFKFIYQSSFGCEHAIADEATVKARIIKEYEEAAPLGGRIDELDGEYCRVSLSYLKEGLSAETLARLFCLSASKAEDGEKRLIEKLDTVRELIRNGTLPFSAEEFDEAEKSWQSLGYPAVHHSEVFRKEYLPSYRVISTEFAPFLPLFAQIDKRLSSGPLKVSIEGGSASGKTSLAGLLSRIYDCTVFHMDDFFLRPEQRTSQRLSEIGGNVDRERFLEDVLLPLSRGEVINYRAFDCSEMAVGKPIEITPERLVITEGAYSMHPELADYYDFSVFLDVSPELQKERILLRNGPELAKRFFNEWIPMENAYFSKTEIRERCDIVIKAEK